MFFAKKHFWFGSIFDNLSSYIKGRQGVLKELCLEDIVVLGQFCAEVSVDGKTYLSFSKKGK